MLILSVAIHAYIFSGDTCLYCQWQGNQVLKLFSYSTEQVIEVSGGTHVEGFVGEGYGWIPSPSPPLHLKARDVFLNLVVIYYVQTMHSNLLAGVI